MTDDNAVLQGGPGDTRSVPSGGEALIEVEIDGVAHRYIRTTREAASGAPIYTYDGAVDPLRAHDGAEHVRERTPSPLLDDMAG